MYVANYLPEPDIRPGSVTKEPYPVRVQFIRAAVLRLTVAIGLIGLITYLVPPAEAPLMAVWVCLGFLFASSLVRALCRNLEAEAKFAAGQLPLLIILISVAARALHNIHFPVWSVLFGVGTMAIYTWVSRRDFSFVGGYILSMIVANVAIACLMVFRQASALQGLYALIWNSVICLYLFYDLAALMYRRTKSETLASVTDLFRDVFNIIGWLPKVVMHWRRHKILNDLSFDLPFRIGQ